MGRLVLSGERSKRASSSISLSRISRAILLERMAVFIEMKEDVDGLVALLLFFSCILDCLKALRCLGLYCHGLETSRAKCLLGGLRFNESFYLRD